jgi:excinuclease ABC subunit A
VIIIEHNLDIIRNADYLIDMGPEGGEFGGRVIAHGTPEQVATVTASHTGYFLRPHFAGLTAIETDNPNAGPQTIVRTPDPIKAAKAKFIAPEKKTGRPTAKAPAKEAAPKKTAAKKAVGKRAKA